jgi:Arc/MetJ-type ribon-helix-helix transcriptional regulator
MNVHLPDEFNEIVNHLVERGRFQSGEEAVAEGPRLLVSREQLREEVAQGFQQIDDGLGIEGDQVFEEVNQSIDAIEKEQLGS